VSSAVSSFGQSDPDSLGNAGSVTAPGAGSGVTTLAAPPAGVYDVTFAFFLSGTAETALANVRVRKGTTNIVNTLPSITGAAAVVVRCPRVTLDGASALSIQSIAAATAGAVYSGWIIATRVG